VRNRAGKPKLLLALAATLALALVLGASLADATAPVVTVEDATNVSYVTASVKGHVNPEGQSTSWRFQYATEADFSNAQEGPSGSTETAEDVSGQLNNLQPKTVYHLRLVAENPDGQSEVVAASTFETLEVTKPTVTIESASGVTDNSAHFAGHVTPGNSDPAFNTDCHFDYVKDSQFQVNEFASAQHIACTPNPVTGTGEAAVQAEPTNLEPNTTYHLRLRASNAGGTETATAVNFATGAIAPTVGTGTNTPDGEGGVFVHAYVNPHNSAVTNCHFDFGLTESYGESAPCEGTIGEVNEPVTVMIDPAGLEAGTLYHFKATATNGAGTEESEGGVFFVPAEEAEACPNETLREEQHATFLPDCRAYEMVSPPDKSGGNVLAYSQRTHAAADGNAAMFLSLAGFGDAIGTSISTEYLSERSTNPSPGNNGWSTHAVTPRQESQSLLATGSASETAYQGEAVSPDLTKGVIRTFSPLTNAPNVANIFNIYLRDDLRSPGLGSYQLLSNCLAPPAGPCEEPLPEEFERKAFGNTLPAAGPTFRPWVAGTSVDFSHVIYETSWALANGASLSFSGNLYESDEGKVSLVGVVPPEGHTECGASDPACVPALASIAGQGAAPAIGQPHYTPHTISADGQKIFFTASPRSCSFTICGTLYMREGNGTSSAETVQLNASERTDCADHHPCTSTPDPDPEGPQPASYWDASVDGSRVFFASSEALTDDAPTGGHGNEMLYMYDTSKPASDPHNLTYLSSDDEPADGYHGVLGVIGASEDGNYVYFAAHGQLVPGEMLREENTTMLYLWHDGQISFVGALTGDTDHEDDFSPYGSLSSPKEARVSPDGRTLLFTSSNGATLLSPPYDQTGPCRDDEASFGPCREFYVYRADTDQLLCASCNPSGEPPLTTATTKVRHRVGPAWPLLHSNRALSADGRYAFFNTGDALVPQDTNGAYDAYRYDTETGKVKLLSTGTDSVNSYFLEASESGKDAFFTTNQKLEGWDIDRSSDLYDARVDGGFPEPRPVPASCTGEVCQGSATAAPGAQTPGSSTLSAPGNPKPHRHKHRKHRKHRGHGRAANSNQGGSK
jgi:hypothetical protein